MYNNLKKLRDENEYTQENISSKLNINRNTYKNWETGYIMIPLKYADKLSVIYNVRLSYILGLNDTINENSKIKKMNYNNLLKNLNKLKQQNKHSYEKISQSIKCSKSTCYDYFKGNIIIPIDRLILLSNLYKIDLDKLCGKE